MPCGSTKLWMAWPISPVVAPGLTAAISAHHRLVGDFNQPLGLAGDGAIE